MSWEMLTVVYQATWVANGAMTMVEGEGYALFRSVRRNVQAYLSHTLSQTTTSDFGSIRHSSTPLVMPIDKMPIQGQLIDSIDLPDYTKLFTFPAVDTGDWR